MADPVLQGNELSELTRRVADLYWFQAGPVERRTLLQQAGLAEFLPFLTLGSDGITFAGELLYKLNTYGMLEAGPRAIYHALGKFLAHLLTLAALDQDNRHYMAALIVRRGLVRDPAYVAQLRERYGIVEPPPPPSPGTVSAPAAVGDFPTPPPFDPGITDADALERIINSADNFLDIHLLQGALYASRAVARVELGKNNPQGTGFLVGPDLFLTCCHVIPRRELLGDVSLRFDYTEDALGARSAGVEYRLAPDLYEASPPEQLDYALVRVAGEPLAALKPDPDTADVSVANLIRLGRHRGYLTLLDDLIPWGQRVNLLQHPDGQPLKVVLTQNRVVADMTATRVHYTADTIGGSSGAPICNRTWDVVGLHHAGKPYPPAQANAKGQPWRGQFVANEGIPMRAILADLKARGQAALLMQS